MLSAENIEIGFSGRRVLCDVNLSCSKGERIAILGPSGSGKSTLLRILSGLLQPDIGIIECNGIKPQFSENSRIIESRKWIWPKITMVFQEFMLFPNLTGEQNCLLGDLGDVGRENLAKWSLKLGVNQCLEKLPIKMSQGERQRIAIIRAILREPMFLLMERI